MRRENCLVNCEIIFHISPFKPANSTKSLYCVCQKKTRERGLFSLELLMGVICERKMHFCWWKIMAFCTWLSSAHLLCWSPAGFFGDLTHTELLCVTLEPRSGGECWFQRRELLLWDGGWWLCARAQVPGSGWVTESSFLKGCVGLIVALLSSPFSKSQFLKEPKSGCSNIHLNVAKARLAV